MIRTLWVPFLGMLCLLAGCSEKDQRRATEVPEIQAEPAVQVEKLPDNYAESVMIALMSEDAKVEVSLRLARFPLTDRGTVWLHIATPNGAWSMADEPFDLENGSATPVSENSASFTASRGGQSVRFISENRNSGLLTGKVVGEFLVSDTRHPELGPGNIRAQLDLDFTARDSGYRDSGRWELTGETTGSVAVGGVEIVTLAEGKWHEQTGPRAAFAPAFRYFNVLNEDAAVLAIQYANRFRGYAMLADGYHDLTAVSIDPPGGSDRSFHLTLDNGRVIEGVSHRVQEWSVPIEGIRRPGSSVVVDSNIGRLTGSLNDWNP